MSRIERGRRVVAVIEGDLTNDTFWSLVRAGFDNASEEFGVSVEHYSTLGFDAEFTASLIDAALNASIEGLVLSISDDQATADVVQAVLPSDFPIVRIKVGATVQQTSAVLAEVGQDDYKTGFTAGVKMKQLGVNNSICLTPDVASSTWGLRCRGFADGFGGPVEILSAHRSVSGLTRILRQHLGEGTGRAGLMVASPDIAGRTLSALDRARLSHQVKSGTFDVNPTVLNGISEGKIAFSVDRQPYLLGYMSILTLNLNKKYGFEFSETVAAGPAFVTEENVQRVIELNASEIR
jgi:simple sugar transport system substrate-binding protein